MRIRTAITAALAVLALTLTACSSDDSGDQADTKPSSPASSTSSDSPADTRHYDSAQDIADALTAAGLNASKPQEETEQTYITEVGGTAYTFTVTDKASPAGDAGINMFPNAEALAAWIPLSKQFGGVAVTGDTWAVSLPTDGEARDDSKRLAPKVAKALAGTVQQ